VKILQKVLGGLLFLTHTVGQCCGIKIESSVNRNSLFC